MKTRPIPAALVSPLCTNCQAHAPQDKRGLCRDCLEDWQRERQTAHSEYEFALSQQPHARTPAELQRLKREAALWLTRRDDPGAVGR